MHDAPMTIRVLRRTLSMLASTLLVAITLAGLARADVPVRDKPDDDGGCLAGGLPWALPVVGVGLVLTIRHRSRNREQGPP